MQEKTGNILYIMKGKSDTQEKIFHTISVPFTLPDMNTLYCELTMLQIRPSSRRLVQYRADLTAILLTSHDLLLSLCTDPGAFFVPPPGAFVRAAHAQCAMLATALAIVGCPIKVKCRLKYEDALLCMNPVRIFPGALKGSGSGYFLFQQL